MNRNYKVIIIDDEVDTFCDEDKLNYCQSEGVEMLKANNIGELEKLLKAYEGWIDAIITDFNFSGRDNSNPKNEQDYSGFDGVRRIVEAYKGKGRDIPYYICSGRPNLVGEYLGYYDLEELTTNGRIFEKYQFREIIAKIKEEADDRQTPEFRIRNQYRSELKAAKSCLSECGANQLLETLVYCEEYYKQDPATTIKYFNQLRKFIEIIQDKCADKGIVPKGMSLNGFSLFMSGKVGKSNPYCFVNGKSLMPPALARGLWYFLDITQDASHCTDSLNLKVDQYVQEHTNVLLLKSIVNIALNICLWFNKYYPENQDIKANQAKWEKVEEKIGRKVYPDY